MVAYYVLQWGLSNTVEFLIINVGTLAGSFLVYEAIKRTNVTRVLFGLKPRRKVREARETALAG
jgi:hypothetical protein